MTRLAQFVTLIVTFILLTTYTLTTAHAAGTCDTVSEIPTAECQALTTLYTSTSGPNWTNKSNWLVTNTPCSWYGVTCSNGHVTGLDLHGNGLQNSLPAELGNLTSLKALYLDTNYLSGNIPSTLGNLTQLTVLNLARNQLSGSLPASIGNLNQLFYLDLQNNYLTGTLPIVLGNLTNLTSFTLDANRFSGSIPKELANLTKLQTLDLWNNSLTGTIPVEIGNLTQLKFLSLSENHLSGSIPTQLGNLISLTTLSLQNNQLSGTIPAELGNITQLPDLYLHNNQLEGEIPSNITKMVGLRDSHSFNIPYFGYNKLTSTNPEVIAFLNQKDPTWSQTQTIPPTNLQATTTTSGNFVVSWQPIPYTYDGGYYEISGATSLNGPYQVLGQTSSKWATSYNASVISNTTYYFKIRTFTPKHGGQQNDLWSGYSTPLQVFPPSLFNCNLVTEIPQTECQALTALYNQTQGQNWTNRAGWLTTTKPCGWYGLSCENGHVISIYLRNNLSGTIPIELSSLTELKTLDLGENRLSGSIPKWIGNLVKLQILILYSNNLSGTMPTELGQLSKLQILSLAANQLSGPIPVQFGNLISLTHLSLHSNQLSGPIPAELGNLTQLPDIYLHNNQLEGEIPSSITKIVGLREIHPYNYPYFSYNKLTSSNPEVIAFLNKKDPTWSQTQTVPPTKLQAVSTSNSNLLLSWQAITYTSHTGYYEISSATSPNGPYTVLGQTDSKTTTNYNMPVVSGTTYYFKVRTFTAKHGDQQNNLWSDYSTVLTVTPPIEFNFNCETVTQIPTLECQALTKLYQTTKGYQWNIDSLYFTSWLTTNQPCQWYGISCSSGHVTRLELNYKVLSGTIPVELANLTELNYLNLSNNQLTGPIPSELGQLTQLVSLNLGNNQLSGTIPPELGQLIKLTNLTLNNNQLSGAIPSELGQLASLNYLYLGGNQLSGEIPAAITNLTKAYSIQLNYNKLFSTNDNVINFLKNKASGWQNYQVRPPTYLQAIAVSSTTIKLTWLPMGYLGYYYGYHEISYGITAPYQVITQVNPYSPITSTLFITNLNPNKTYYFKMRNFVPASYNNSNNLWSDDSATVSVTLTPNASLCNSISEIPAAECQAMLALYDSTNGQNWYNWSYYTNKWLLNETPCQWSGVVCTNGHVTTLNLNNVQLKGTLPTKIGNLKYLVKLDLASNALSGTIPSEIGNLTNLTTLALGYNQFRGEIPSTIINLTQLPLKNLNSTILGYNKLVSTNDSVKNFLNIKDNFWTYQTVPPTNLAVTQLTDTSIKLTWTPIVYASYSNYYEISYALSPDGPYTVYSQLYNTALSSFQINNLVANTTYFFKIRTYTPASWSYQSNALWSDYSPVVAYPDKPFVGCSQVQQIPQSECEALIALYNSTEGANWGNLPWYLTNTPCNWTGVSCANGHVTGLNLASNGVKGSLPSQIGDLSYLTSLSIYDSDLGGSIPKEIGKLSKLQSLQLFNNQLSGTIPAELGQLTQLQYLLLSDNQLSGTIPAELGQLTQLQYLHLSDNYFSGAIPSTLGNLTQLNQLCLGNNQLEGEIPESITQLTLLSEQTCYSYLLGFNKLTTTNPQVLNFLQIIDPYWQETQTVPPTQLKVTVNNDKALLAWQPISYTANVGYYEISSATSPNGIYNVLGQTADKTVSSYETPAISNTTHYFKIRTFTANTGYQQSDLWSDYSSVVSITLKPPATNCNDVTQIPVAECQALVALYNQTQGANWLTHTNWLAFDNPCNWAGVTCENSHVTALNLASNQLQGDLPAEITNLTYLTSLDLSHNYLSGQFPTQIGQLANLNKLFLGYNQLIGELPLNLLQLDTLHSFDISYNKLTTINADLMAWLNQVSQGNCMSIIKNFKEITFIPTRLQSFGVGTHLGGFFLIEQIKGNMS